MSLNEIDKQELINLELRIDRQEMIKGIGINNEPWELAIRMNEWMKRMKPYYFQHKQCTIYNTTTG